MYANPFSPAAVVFRPHAVFAAADAVHAPADDFARRFGRGAAAVSVLAEPDPASLPPGLRRFLRLPARGRNVPPGLAFPRPLAGYHHLPPGFPGAAGRAGRLVCPAGRPAAHRGCHRLFAGRHPVSVWCGDRAGAAWRARHRLLPAYTAYPIPGGRRQGRRAAHAGCPRHPSAEHHRAGQPADAQPAQHTVRQRHL